MTFARLVLCASLAFGLCLFFRWGPRQRLIRPVLAGLDWLSQRKAAVVIGIGLLGGGLSALMAAFSGLPQPAILDEYSYLLMADTFAHGRLTNPPHPMGEFFETIHVLQRPTYASKYPPGTAILLAAGKVFAGHPAAGIWLGVGLACGGACWMMFGWTRPRWAIVGSLMVCAWLLLGYWSSSYWGGAVPMFGGVLVYGGLRRILQQPRLRDSLVFGLGLLILANTRPFEGLVVSLPAGVFLLAGLFGRHRPPLRSSLDHVVLPIAGVLAVGAVAMGYYNYRVTGSAWLTPYQLYRQTIHEPPLFLWQSLPEEKPPLVNQAIENYSYGFCRGMFEAQKSTAGFAEASWQKLKYYGTFFLGPILAVPILVLAVLGRNRWSALLLATLSVLLLALLSETWFQPHYAAPAAGLVFLTVVQGLRRMSTMRSSTRRAGMALAVVALGAWIAILPGSLQTNHEVVIQMSRGLQGPVLEWLGKQPGSHLVLVSEAPHFRHLSWINNEADIDGSRVVWARDLGPAKDEELLRYFKGRRVWSFQADKQPPVLKPMSPE